jgi:sugar phosphate isomerase/epimerase
MRNGSGPLDLALLDPAEIGYVQFCDGPIAIDPKNMVDEALYNRMPPGEGEFPLREILACIPSDRCLSLEVPMTRRRDGGMDALARAKLLQQTTRGLLRSMENG